MTRFVPLSDIIRRVPKVKADTNLAVYSVTKHSGFVRSDAYFKKQVYSKDLTTYKTVLPGQMAYATIHLDEGSIGEAPERCLISPMYTVFEHDRDIADGRYLLRFLKAPQTLEKYASIGTGSAERRRSISLEALGKIEFPLLPLPEQRRIAAMLDQTDAIRNNRRKSLSYLNQLLDSRFDTAFEQSSWPISSLGSVASIQGGITANKTRESHPLKVDYLRVANVSRGTVDLSEVKKIGVSAAEFERTRLQIGDILVVEGHGNISELGRAARWADQSRPISHQNHLIRVRAIPGVVRPEFLERYLNSRSARAYFRSVSKTTSGLNTINMSNVKALPVIVPPLAQQDEFVGILLSAERAGNAQCRHLQKLDELFAALQRHAFDGSL
jgi:type I restriction enzyme S subunit